MRGRVERPSDDLPFGPWDIYRATRVPGVLGVPAVARNDLLSIARDMGRGVARPFEEGRPTMAFLTVHSKSAAALFAAAAAFTLSACGQAEEESRYEADAEDLSGGDLQVADPDPDAVPVTVPKTEMTNAPPQEAEPTAEE